MSAALHSEEIARFLPDHPELGSYVAACAESAVLVLDSISNVFAEYTDHGSSHALAVLRLGSSLSIGNQLSAWERAVFALASYHHDIGMACSDEEISAMFDSDDFRRTQPYLERTLASAIRLEATEREILDRFIMVEYVRRRHASRSALWILKHYPKEQQQSYVGEVYLWDAVALVAEAHGVDLESLDPSRYSCETLLGSGLRINLPYLACLLRLADLCHFGRDRALPYLREAKQFYSLLSRDIWRRYADISDTQPTPDREIIQVSAQCSDPVIHGAILHSARCIEQELLREHRYLQGCNSSYRMPWKCVDTTQVRPGSGAAYSRTAKQFELNYSRIMDLLMGSRLYRDELFALRECIQNSLDAIQVCKSHLPDIRYYVLLSYFENDEKAILDIYDNGTGMDEEICLRHLLSVGSDSFWGTERCWLDWQFSNKNHTVIASHGIGFLSTFMISESVEVFSKYPDRQEVHLCMPSATADTYFLAARPSRFPRWVSTVPGFSTPRAHGHGTCVRLHLKRKWSAEELVRFLALNIPRPSCGLHLDYSGQYAELPPVWHPVSTLTDLQPSARSLEEIVRHYYSEKDHFYEGPAKDPSISRDVAEAPGMVGYAFITDGERHAELQRVSQNGILVPDAARFVLDHPLFGGSRLNYSSPLEFDIDLRGNLTLDLDAERARPLTNGPNLEKRETIVTQLIRCATIRTATIESSLYFPCGGVYYHGIPDVIGATEGMTVAFHHAMSAFFTRETFGFVQRERLADCLTKARIYSLLDEHRNKPASACDLALDQVVYIPKGDARRILGRAHKKLTATQTDELRSIFREHGSVLILPGFPETFLLPLILKFGLAIVRETETGIQARLVAMDSLADPFEAWAAIRVGAGEKE